MSSPFADILHRVVMRTPGAVGGSLAAGDGETVDYVAVSAMPDRDRPNAPVSAGPGEDLRSQWALLTAHHGILLGHFRQALGAYHYGDFQLAVISHGLLRILLHRVDADYFAVLAIEPSAPVAPALHQLSLATDELRQEMGL